MGQANQTNQLAQQLYSNAVVDRMPPNSVEAEEAVLGSALIDPEALERIVQVLSPKDFYITKNEWVFDAMVTMRARQEPIDFVTIIREMAARGQLDEMGGPAYISMILNSVPTAIHAEGYARIVKRLSIRRGMLSILSDGAQAAYEEAEDEIVALGEVGNRITALKYAAIARLSNQHGFMSSDDVLLGEWPEPMYVIPGVLTAGLGFLHGKPKRGKSWLMMQIACAKACGGRVFNQLVERGPVLYLALEDNARRLQSRMRKQQWPRQADVTFVLADQFEKEFGNLAEGGADRIAYLIDQKGYHLVVIDTFNRAIGQYLKASESNDAGTITKALSGLQQYAVQKNTCVAIVDHQSKASRNDGGDSIDDVFGSIAKSGVSDWMWGFYREQGSRAATLNISGRDIEEQVMLLNWDVEFGQWNFEGAGNGIRMTTRRQEILDAIVGQKSHRAMLQTIADCVRQPKSHTHERLKELVDAGLVRRIEEGANVWFESVDESA
jgi:hypothetical protein